MSRNLTKIFSYCAALSAIILLFSLFNYKNESDSIAIAKSIDNEPGNTASFSLQATESSVVTSNNNNFSNNSSNDSVQYQVEYVDITQNYIPPAQSTSGNESSENQSVPKTPNIELSYNNDCINVCISQIQIKSFKLYRAVNDGSFDEVCLVAGSSYKDSAVQDGNTYSYKAICTRTDGTSVYTYTNKISIEKLAAISGVNAKCGISEITITWNTISGAKYYDMYRIEDGANKKIKSVTIASFSDSGLTENTAYVYKIYARDANGNKIAASENLSYKTLYLPTAPVLKLYSNDGFGIEIAWKPIEGALSYNVYKYIGGSFVLVKNTKNNYYIDSTASGTCTYAVSAIGSAGEGEKSSTISATAVK